MDEGSRRQLDVLAEIISSKRVGRDHVRLAAEIVIIDDDLTAAVLAFGEPTAERWFEANEIIQDRVDEYQESWEILNSIHSMVEDGSLTPRARSALGRLALAMRASIDQYKISIEILHDFHNGETSSFGRI